MAAPVILRPLDTAEGVACIGRMLPEAERRIVGRSRHIHVTFTLAK